MNMLYEITRHELRKEISRFYRQSRSDNVASGLAPDVQFIVRPKAAGTRHAQAHGSRPRIAGATAPRPNLTGCQAGRGACRLPSAVRRVVVRRRTQYFSVRKENLSSSEQKARNVAAVPPARRATSRMPRSLLLTNIPYDHVSQWKWQVECEPIMEGTPS